MFQCQDSEAALGLFWTELETHPRSRPYPSQASPQLQAICLFCSWA